VTGFYEDAQSIADRARMYRNLDVLKIGFWKIGQEDRGVWPYLKVRR
jgi:spore germination protein YaaH